LEAEEMTMNTSYRFGAGVVIGIMSGLVFLAATTGGSKTTVESVEANSKPIVITTATITAESLPVVKNNEYIGTTLIFKDCEGVLGECQRKEAECISNNGSVEGCNKEYRATATTLVVETEPEKPIAPDAPEKPSYNPPQLSRSLLCRDGTTSPTCMCSNGSHRGCCSHHGGIAGCEKEDDDDRNMAREYELEYRKQVSDYSKDMNKYRIDMKAYSKAMVEYRKHSSKK
jgi:hypothetical protein